MRLAAVVCLFTLVYCCAELKVVDVGGYSSDREPAAGATMTSSQCDPDVDGQQQDAAGHAQSADTATPTATARGQ